jgi:hypothetical protein
VKGKRIRNIIRWQCPVHPLIQLRVKIDVPDHRIGFRLRELEIVEFYGVADELNAVGSGLGLNDRCYKEASDRKKGFHLHYCLIDKLFDC